MTLQEHIERLRRSFAEIRIGGAGFADLGRSGRGYADRALAGLGRIDVGGLLADLAAAIAFYTRLPLRPAAAIDGAAVARASWCAPLVGALIGALAGLAYWIAWRLNLPPLVGATLAIAAGMLITGCLHEDGLADTADGLGGGTTRERALDIMRDGRIGAFGACALIICVALRIGTVADLPRAALVAWALVGAHATARAVLPAFMCLVPPARPDGLSATAGAPSPARAAVAAAIGVALLWIAFGFRNALISLVLVLVGAAVLALIARRKIGGQTGDVLGAVEQVSETLVLLVTAARF
jgi:adenosylcobinamide-GDP ribazoletransferase